MTIPYVWHPIPGVDGGTYDNNPALPVLVLHTTEGRSIAAAEAAYKLKSVAPHYTADLRYRTVAKHLSTHKSASALKNLPGGVQTNRRGTRVVQVEIVGFASDSPNRSDDDLTFLGQFIRQLAVEDGFPLTPVLASHDRDQVPAHRLTPREWLGFSGICAHQHVPENDHWDCGLLNVQRALALSSPTTPLPPTSLNPEDDTMFLARLTGSSSTYLFESGRATHMASQSDVNAMVGAIGNPVASVSKDTWDALVKDRKILK